MPILFVKYYQKIEKINTVVVLLGISIVVDSLVTTMVDLDRISIVNATMVLSDHVASVMRTYADGRLIVSHVVMIRLFSMGDGTTGTELSIVDIHSDGSESRRIIIGDREAGFAAFTVGQ